MKVTIGGCNGCICQNCLYYWSCRCPHGKCYDNKRAIDMPFDKTFPERPPRTGWSNWKTDQAYWCRGGINYPTDQCEQYVEYAGSTVQHCLLAMVQIFQDGYISCSLVETLGCKECYQRFIEKQEGTKE